MIDRSTITTRFALIEQCLQALEDTKEKGNTTYIDDFNEQLKAERALQIAIEACIDIGNHIISARGFRKPKDYADVFRILREEKVISRVMSETMVELVKFRNRLVHIYTDLDNDLVFSFIQEQLDDFKKYLSEITLFLEADSDMS